MAEQQTIMERLHTLDEKAKTLNNKIAKVLLKILG